MIGIPEVLARAQSSRVSDGPLAIQTMIFDMILRHKKPPEGGLADEGVN